MIGAERQPESGKPHIVNHGGMWDVDPLPRTCVPGGRLCRVFCVDLSFR